MTIEQTIDIPKDRHLRLDLTLPESFSAGQGRIILFDNAAKGQKPFRPMPTIAECIREAEERAAMERATGYNPLEKSSGCLKDDPSFAGRDGMEIQIEMRNEWPD
jgi:hypothetical protein